MKVLMCGDSPSVSTGFAGCTRAAAAALHAAGHEVHILGINEGGDSDKAREYPYNIYPCYHPHDGGRDIMGVTRLPRLIDRLSPDVVVLLNDPWNVRGYFQGCDNYGFKRDELPPFVAWLAVDGINQHGDELNDLRAVMVWTKFAEGELRDTGCTVPISIVPLGVDTEVFKQRSQHSARLSILEKVPNVPLSSFLVGVVGRNQMRKRLDLTLRYFAKWIQSQHIEDAYLLMHVAPTGDQGVDLPALAKFYDIESRVLVRKPNIGHGDSLDSLVSLYNSCDVYVSTSQGEGWGLPALEAMACGVPCVLPDFAAFAGAGGWPGHAAELVPVAHHLPSGPYGGKGSYILGAVPDEDAFVTSLDNVYRAPKHRQALSQRGRRLAETLTWGACGQSFVAALESAVTATAVTT